MAPAFQKNTPSCRIPKGLRRGFLALFIGTVALAAFAAFWFSCGWRHWPQVECFAPAEAAAGRPFRKVFDATPPAVPTADLDRALAAPILTLAEKKPLPAPRPA